MVDNLTFQKCNFDHAIFSPNTANLDPKSSDAGILFYLFIHFYFLFKEYRMHEHILTSSLHILPHFTPSVQKNPLITVETQLFRY